MPDIIVSNEDLAVFGGPASIDVNLGFGSTGVRGSRIYSLTGDPRTLTTEELPSDLQEYDLAIVVDADAQNAFGIFQKVGTSPQSWEPLPPLAINVFSTKQQITFLPALAGGYAVAAVPVSAIFDLNEYTVDKFVVQYQLEDTAGTPNNYPTSSSMSLSIVPDVENNIQNLVAIIRAVEFDGTNWVPVVDTTRTIHAFITVI
jgi:hypothetical protein